MELEGCVALVTGANRGLGKAYTDALLEAGAAKVYAGARDPASIADPRVVPVALDVTNAAQVAAAAARCADVTVLINNAGIMIRGPLLAPSADDELRATLEVNVFGVLRMTRAFAPVLKRKGGGAVVNVLSVVSWFVPASSAAYAASKHAALAITDGLRFELKAQGTAVTAVYAGYIDTDMTAGIDLPKLSAREVADATLAGIRTGAEDVRVGARAQQTWELSRTDPAALRARSQAEYEAGTH